MEHAFIYAGKQIPDKWAVIRLCERTHLGDLLNKEINHWIALSHAQPEDLVKYPKTNWKQLTQFLNKKYGQPKHN